LRSIKTGRRARSAASGQATEKRPGKIAAPGGARSIYRHRFDRPNDDILQVGGLRELRIARPGRGEGALFPDDKPVVAIEAGGKAGMRRLGEPTHGAGSHRPELKATSVPGGECLPPNEIRLTRRP